MSEPRPYPSSGRAAFALGVLMLTTFTALLDRYLLGLLLEPIRTEFRISDTQVSLLQGLAFAVFYSVLGLPFGRLVDRANRRNIITAGVVLWSLTTMACGLAGNFATLFVARLGVGLGEACLAPAAYSLITDLFPPRRHGRALAWFTVASIVGGGGSFIIGAQALHLATALTGPQGMLPGVTPWRLTFVIVGSPGLLAAILMLMLREPVRQGPGHQKDQASWHDLARFMSGIRWPLAAIIGAGSALTVAGSGIMGWLVVFLSRSYGVPAIISGHWIGLLIIASGLLGGAASGRLGDSRWISRMRGQRFNVVLIGSVGAAVFVTIFPLMPNVDLALTVFVLYAVTYNVAACAAPVVLQDILPNQFKGQVGAFYWLCVGLIGFGGGSTAVALVTDRMFGDPNALRYSMAIVGVLTMCLACVAVLVGRSSYQRLRDIVLAGEA